MTLPVIPAPVRFDGGGDHFVLRTGTTVTHTATEVAPTVERFCTEVERRTGLRLSSTLGNPASGESSVRIELATGNELGVFTAPIGLSPTGDDARDERHSTIDANQVVVRAAEPVGVGHGLTTLLPQSLDRTTRRALERSS